MTDCNQRHSDKDSIFAESIVCNKGEMKPAWYGCGNDEKIPFIVNRSNAPDRPDGPGPGYN